MGLIKNFHDLATTPERKILLEVIEAGLDAIQPDRVIRKKIRLQGNLLTIGPQQYDLRHFDRVFLLGFGKGSAGICKQLEKILGEKLTKGFVIDTSRESFTRRIQFTLGTHPLPSKENYAFTQKVIQEYKDLTEKDLVLITVCGGGSAMLVAPVDGVTLDEKINVNKALLKSGADIIEMNTVRKHLSAIKGGQLAKTLYPAQIASIIFSDVPGNDLSFIASGPTVKDKTTVTDAREILKKYKLEDKLTDQIEHLTETPKDAKYFARVDNILLLSNVSALDAMVETAKKLGYRARIFSDKFQSDAKEAAAKLIERTNPGEIVVAGGETTVKVKGNGEGGRNQVVVLSVLPDLEDKTIIASIASDGWDNSPHAGAIGDSQTVDTELKKGIDAFSFMANDDSFHYFEKVGDGINTGRLPSNVSDLFVVMKKR